MILVQQPDNSLSCGQCCVAMLLGITRGQVICQMGSEGRTTTRMIRKALGGLRLTRKRAYPPVSGTALMLMQTPTGRHWVLWVNGEVWCPDAGRYYVNQMIEGYRSLGFYHCKGTLV